MNDTVNQIIKITIGKLTLPAWKSTINRRREKSRFPGGLPLIGPGINFGIAF
jgi:hypothetical protein